MKESPCAGPAVSCNLLPMVVRIKGSKPPESLLVNCLPPSPTITEEFPELVIKGFLISYTRTNYLPTEVLDPMCSAEVAGLGKDVVPRDRHCLTARQQAGGVHSPGLRSTRYQPAPELSTVDSPLC